MTNGDKNPKPRWLYEPLGLIKISDGKKIVRTEEDKKRSKEFSDAVNSGRIDEWFANNGKLND
ncbi:MAG: hypothetical protein RR702_06285 [Clostridia bacterium]